MPPSREWVESWSILFWFLELILSPERQDFGREQQITNIGQRNKTSRGKKGGKKVFKELEGKIEEGCPRKRFFFFSPRGGVIYLGYLPLSISLFHQNFSSDFANRVTVFWKSPLLTPLPAPLSPRDILFVVGRRGARKCESTISCTGWQANERLLGRNVGCGKINVRL